MALLAVGDQCADPESMLLGIFSAATHWLHASLPIDIVKLVVHTSARAA
jgi:hypothetical protein